MDVIRAGLVSEEHEANDMPAPSLPFKPVFGNKAPPPPEPQIALHPDDVQAIREVILEAAERVGMTPGAAEGHAVSFLTFAQRLRVFPLPVATARMLDDSYVRATTPSTRGESANVIADKFVAHGRVKESARTHLVWAVKLLIQARMLEPTTNPAFPKNKAKLTRDVEAVMALVRAQAPPLSKGAITQLRWAMRTLQKLGDGDVSDFFRREEPLSPTPEFLVSRGAPEAGAAALAEWIKWWELRGREGFKRS